MNNYIFLIVGPSGSGKSTIVEQLVEYLEILVAYLMIFTVAKLPFLAFTTK